MAVSPRHRGVRWSEAACANRLVAADLISATYASAERQQRVVRRLAARGFVSAKQAAPEVPKPDSFEDMFLRRAQDHWRKSYLQKVLKGWAEVCRAGVKNALKTMQLRNELHAELMHRPDFVRRLIFTAWRSTVAAPPPQRRVVVAPPTSRVALVEHREELRVVTRTRRVAASFSRRRKRIPLWHVKKDPPTLSSAGVVWDDKRSFLPILPAPTPLPEPIFEQCEVRPAITDVRRARERRFDFAYGTRRPGRRRRRCHDIIDENDGGDDKSTTTKMPGARREEDDDVASFHTGVSSLTTTTSNLLPAPTGSSPRAATRPAVLPGLYVPAVLL